MPDWNVPPDTPAGKTGWFILLALGSLQSLGRQSNEQNRGFLSKLINRRWLDQLLNVKNDRTSFVKVLEEYFRDEDEQEYLHWLRGLPIFYQLSKWIEEYTYMLLEFDKPSSQQTLRDFLNPRSSAYYQGAGFEAPNLSRSMRTGVHFVLRELRRTAILKSEQIDAHCFVPRSIVMRRFGLLTGETLPEEKAEASEAIYHHFHKHLGDERATFFNCYDIPLQVISDQDFAGLF